MKYAHVLATFTSDPWALTEHMMGVLRDLLEFRANGGTLTDEQIQARIGDGQRAGLQQHGSVAVVPMHGPIYPRATLFSDVSGGVSLERLGATMNQLVADPNIASIVLDVNSPGGSVVGVLEFAEQMRAWRKEKPIIAVANHLMASAAYWIGANASEVVASKSASVGSVGVYMTHVDESAALEKQGVKIRILSAGKHKAEGGSHEPLSESAEAHIMERINEVYGWMVRDIAKGMNTSAETVRNGFGEGRVLGAEKALAAGMIHRVATLEDVLRDQVSAKSRHTMPLRAQAVLPEVNAVSDAVLPKAADPAEHVRPMCDDERTRWNIL